MSESTDTTVNQQELHTNEPPSVDPIKPKGQKPEGVVPPPELRIKPVIPEGMSKKQWKKEQKRLKFLEQKPEFNKIRKQKKLQRRALKREKIQELLEKGESIEHLIKRKIKPEDQTKLPSKIIIDCSFDYMMRNDERISLSTQLTRAYSAVRNSKIVPTLQLTSFNKLLKKRFDEDLISSNYNNWINVEIDENDLKIENPENYIYLSSDAPEDLNELDENINYIIGGIVDKGRYKNLCYDKAKELGIKSYRLPIDEYIKLSGRRVLTTTHVVELLLKWYELKDWKKAFEIVLPQRKMAHFDDDEILGEIPTIEGDNSDEEDD
ncbi:hypothetical protein WICMUC_003633 [Wickerhamomyces mucosus]|uniref:tRNA (guanine(9)-N1)-methyltransferase n=1 Tax=Wickerhamomyces mucosus TaxID=1378264 RepID=A0A9P8PLD8_9ASCO|nr:hypothetical protein WICMUC_003633 [Wickerhamomyces mucosus]